MTRAARRAGILAGLAAACQISLFPPVGAAWLAWVALVPLLLAVTAVGPGRAAVIGWLFGSLAAAGLVTAWLWPALAEFFGAPLGVRVALLGLATQLAGGVPLALFGWLASRSAGRTPGPRVLALASAWVAVEYGRGRVPYALPWAPLGAALDSDGLVSQVADLGGVYAVSFVVAAVNAALAVAAAAAGTHGGRAARRAGAPLAVGVLVLALACGYGALRRPAVAGMMAAAPRLRVGLVHAELENARRQGAASGVAALDRYLALGPPAGAVDLVVWPENAVNLLLVDNPSLVARIAAQAGSVPYLVGAPRTVTGAAGAALRTSALLIAGGAVQSAYDKRRLLPFAETMPSVRGAGAALPHGFTAGTAPGVIDAGPARLGALICWEAIFPDLARAAVGAGATLLVNLSNDSWFAPGAGPAQHARFAELRAVELRRALVRAANRGVTMVVLPDGRRPVATDGATEGVEVATVPLLTAPTVYARIGDAFAWTCVAVAALVAIHRRRTSAGRMPADRSGFAAARRGASA